MVGNKLQDVQIQDLVDRTLLDVDRDKDGLISFHEFRKALGSPAIASKLVVQL
jgi:serine/threonine-protein phosphatase 2B regulatory subunit